MKAWSVAMGESVDALSLGMEAHLAELGLGGSMCEWADKCVICSKALSKDEVAACKRDHLKLMCEEDGRGGV